MPYDPPPRSIRAHLSAALRDNVCEQCHLNGQARLPRRGRGWLDYRPGLPLESFFAVFVAASPRPGENKAVTHVEQMRRSACYRRSPDTNKLGCVSCHDPHEKPAAGDRVRYFRDRCLACHRTQGCSAAGGGPGGEGEGRFVHRLSYAAGRVGRRLTAR
ncbi:MAG: hypothetical protein U0736_00720 [Gemmataceae bacterium]